jgi:hypothetical protein
MADELQLGSTVTVSDASGQSTQWTVLCRSVRLGDMSVCGLYLVRAGEDVPRGTDVAWQQDFTKPG